MNDDSGRGMSAIGHVLRKTFMGGISADRVGLLGAPPRAHDQPGALDDSGALDPRRRPVATRRRLVGARRRRRRAARRVRSGGAPAAAEA